MKSTQTLSFDFIIKPSEFNDNILNLVYNKCADLLLNNIVDGIYIHKIIDCDYIKSNKVNNDGTVKLNVRCNCEVVNPVVGDQYEIEITDINKMGYSYKLNKLCIFIPLHICKQVFTMNEIVKIKIIGKRIEDSIICIGEPL